LICASRSARWAAVASGLLCLTDCSSATRDVVPSSSDIVVDGGAAAQSPDYEYIARRPLGAVALAEARGIDAALARTAVDRLADALNRCVTKRSQEGALVDGAARLVVRVASDGQVAATTQLKIDPGLAHGAAEAAVLCLLAPAKMLTFPPADGDSRGLAIEAIWGQLKP
jgi:hypothetical protein